MSEFADLDEGPHWDEVVDVICVGAGPGLLAYGLCCLAADLDVLFIDAPARPDPDLVGFIAAMTEDLDDQSSDPERPFFTADPASPPSGRGVVVETFVGQQLRDWAARCLVSQSGVMFTQIPEVLTTMRTDAGEWITAAILDLDSPPSPYPADGQLVALVFHEGRIAGVELTDGSRVGAGGGLALPLGPAGADWPFTEQGVEVAVVGRPFGRFARLEQLRR
ncbi:MAG: hypothetical protein ACR2JM_11305 [Mycobacterium sp.]